MTSELDGITIKNCDHSLERIVLGFRGEPRCSNCDQELTDSQMAMMAQKGRAHAQDMIDKRDRT